jgi:hypothetical protein
MNFRIVVMVASAEEVPKTGTNRQAELIKLVART